MRLPLSSTTAPEVQVLALKCRLSGAYPAGRINREGLLVWRNAAQPEVCVWKGPHPLLSWVGWKTKLQRSQILVRVNRFQAPLLVADHLCAFPFIFQPAVTERLGNSAKCGGNITAVPLPSGSSHSTSKVSQPWPAPTGSLFLGCDSQNQCEQMLLRGTWKMKPRAREFKAAE